MSSRCCPRAQLSGAQVTRHRCHHAQVERGPAPRAAVHTTGCQGCRLQPRFPRRKQAHGEAPARQSRAACLHGSRERLRQVCGTDGTSEGHRPLQPRGDGCSTAAPQTPGPEHQLPVQHWATRRPAAKIRTTAIAKHCHRTYLCLVIQSHCCTSGPCILCVHGKKNLTCHAKIQGFALNFSLTSLLAHYYESVKTEAPLCCLLIHFVKVTTRSADSKCLGIPTEQEPSRSALERRGRCSVSPLVTGDMSPCTVSTPDTGPGAGLRRHRQVIHCYGEFISHNPLPI